jgi:hypothetical protein
MTKNHANIKPGPWERIRKAALFITFADQGLERRFLQKQHKDNLANNRVLSSIGLAIFSIYYLLNYIVLPFNDTLLYALPYLLGFAGFSLIIAATSLKLSHRAFNLLVLASMISTNLSMLISIMSLTYPDTLYLRCGSVILALVGLMFARISLYYLIGFAAIFMMMFELQFMLTGPHNRVELLDMNFLLFMCMGVGLIVAYNMEKRERINFVKLRIIIEERMKLSRLKDATPADAPKTKK